MAGEWYPYNLVDRITFGAAGTGTLTLTVGATEEFAGERIFFVPSTGTFNIVKMYDASGKPYSNCDSNNPIPGVLYDTTLAQRTDVDWFMVELNLPPNTTLYIEVSGGTSTATLDCVIVGKKRVI